MLYNVTYWGVIMDYRCGFATEYLKKFVKDKGIDFVGIASPDRLNGVPERFHPSNLMKNVRSIIVCGNVVPYGSLLGPGTLYHKVIEMTHLQLDQIALNITQEIEKWGNLAVPISTHAPYYYWEEERQYGHGDLSIKHVAEAAGLGKIGKSGVFISEEFGALTRLVCVLTDMELEPDPLINWEPCPEDCRLCIDVCPVNAIKFNGDFEQALCRKNIFKKTLRGIQFEDCRECLKVCPWTLKRENNKEESKRFIKTNNQKVKNHNDEKKKIVISTLGPTGTCSEYASQFFNIENNIDGQISLFCTFEEAVTSLKEGKADYVIIPSAYNNLAEIIFQGRNEIEIVDVFKLATPGLVVANRDNNKEIKKVATHASPISLAKGYFPDAQLVISKSNSNSVELLLADEVDACITTNKCANIYSLNVVHEFGEIQMGWNVLKRKSKLD